MSNAATTEARDRSIAIPSGLGSRLLDRGLLLGIAVVTCLVSLPRFHALMLSANEQDARQAAEWLERLASTGEPSATSLASLVALPGAQHRLVDLRMESSGTVATYHGYRLRLVQVGERTGILAWPSTPDRTGRKAFLKLSGSPTLEARDWSAVGFPPRIPQDPAAVGWSRAR